MSEAERSEARKQGILYSFETVMPDPEDTADIVKDVANLIFDRCEERDLHEFVAATVIAAEMKVFAEARLEVMLIQAGRADPENPTGEEFAHEMVVAWKEKIEARVAERHPYLRARLMEAWEAE